MPVPEKPANAAAAGGGTAASAMDNITNVATLWRTTIPVTDTDVRAEAVEQVMRSCDDDLAVLPFLDVPPRSAQAAAALGRLLSAYPQRLLAGSPLIALVTGSDVDPHWRETHPAREQSLFGHLEFLISLYGPPGQMPSYEALELLRARSEDDLGHLG